MSAVLLWASRGSIIVAESTVLLLTIRTAYWAPRTLQDGGSRQVSTLPRVLLVHGEHRVPRIARYSGSTYDRSGMFRGADVKAARLWAYARSSGYGIDAKTTSVEHGDIWPLC